MVFEVKRASELMLVSLLKEALPFFNFYPAKGGDDFNATTLPHPPFGVVWIDTSEKTMAQEETWIVHGTVVWVSNADETDPADHSNNFKQIYDVLAGLGRGVDLTRKLVVHGIDLTNTDEFYDTDRQAIGDVARFSLGVSERLQS
jgi:hypothetical protein